LEFNPLHKYRAVFAHDGIPLQIGAHEQITLAPAIVGQGRTRGVEIEGHDWQDHIHAPLAAQQYFLVRLVNQLGETDPRIEFEWADLVAMLIGKLVRRVPLAVLREVKNPGPAGGPPSRKLVKPRLSAGRSYAQTGADVTAMILHRTARRHDRFIEGFPFV